MNPILHPVISSPCSTKSEKLGEPVCKEVVSGHKVKFFFSERRVKAFAKGASGYQEVIYLPKILEKLSCKEQLSTVISSSQMRLAKLDQSYKIYCDPKLLGGGGYDDAYELLRAHLEALSNPFLVNEVLQKFQDCEEIASDRPIAEGLGESFGKDWPETIKKLFRNYSEQTVGYLCCEDKEQIGRRRKEILHHYSQLLKGKRDYKKIWPELKCLLTIPAVKKLEPSQIDVYIKELLEDEPEGESIEKMEQLFSEKELEQINNHIRSIGVKEYENADLVSLIYQTVEQKPKTSLEGILTNWNQEHSFFIGRILTLEESQKKYIGEITKIERISDLLKLYLTDRTVVTIDRKKKSITRVEKDSHALPFLLTQSSLLKTEGDRFEIENATLHREAGSFPVGEYHLVKSKFNVKIILNPLNPPYHLITVKTSKSAEYTIKIHLKNDRPERVEWRLWSGDWKEWPLSDFGNCKGLICKKHTIEVTDLDQQVKISVGGYTESFEKIQITKVIEAKLHKVKNHFKCREEIFYQLFDELIVDGYRKCSTASKEGLEEICSNYQSLQDIEKILGEICESYKLLGIEKKSIGVLKEILLEINYEHIVKKEKAIATANLMEMLSVSHHHLNKILGKPLVVVMGFTGSGKSSAICYFLGGKIDNRSKNALCDVVTTLTNPDPDTEKFPVIGTSLSKSETKYSQGYPLPRHSPHLIVDSPGFKDTRGEDYDLCASLSMDQIFQERSEIKSIVITAPIQIFSTERTNHLMELATIIENRFPEIFQCGNTNRKRFFILVTKREQVDTDIVKSFKDRLGQLLEESEEHLAHLRVRRAEGEQISDTDLCEAELRERVCRALLEMQNNKQIDVINYRNSISGQELLKKYTAGVLSKTSYEPNLRSSLERRRFSESVEKASHTWLHYFFSEYLKEFPKEIDKLKKKFKDVQTQLATKAKSYKAKQAEIQVLQTQQEEIKKGLTEEGSSSEQFRELIEKTDNACLQTLNKTVEDLKRDLVVKRKNLQSAIKKVEEISKLILQEQKNITQRKKEIQELQNPSRFYEDCLHKFIPKKEDPLTLFAFKDPKTEQISIDAMREVSREEMSSIRRTTVAEFNDTTQPWYIKCLGLHHLLPTERTLRHSVFIDREYLLVSPNDQFSARQMNSNEFAAEITGEKFYCDIAKRSPCGTKVKYIVTTTWDGKELPHFTINHTIPSRAYYSARIANLQAENETTQSKLKKHQNERSDKKAEQNGLKKEVKKLTEDLKRKEKEKNQRTSEEMTTWILRRMGEVEKETKIAEQEVEKCKQEVKELQEKIEKLEREKKRSAVIIWTQQESSKMLRKICEHILNTENTSSQNPEALQKEKVEKDLYKKYIEIFDQEFENLLSSARKDLEIEEAV